MKMGQRLSRGRGLVTYQSRYASLLASGSRLAAAGPAAHFDRNESHVSYGTGHWVDL